MRSPSPRLFLRVVALSYLLHGMPALAQGVPAPSAVLPVQPKPVDIFNPSTANNTPPDMSMNVNLIEAAPARIMTFIFSIFTIVSIIVAIYAGAVIIFSNGDQKRVEQGVKALIFAAIGMLVIGGAWLIVRLVLNIDLTQI